MAEASYTNTLHPFNERQIIKIKPKIKGQFRDITTALAPQEYHSIKDLVDGINSAVKKAIQDQEEMTPHLTFNSIVQLHEGHVGSFIGKLILSKTITNVLGLDRGGVPYLNASNSSLYVYSDLVAPRVVGDVSAPLLRVLNTQSNLPFGFQIHQHFRKPQYCEVANQEIEEIEVWILDDTGRPPLFRVGNITITLHFKRQ